MRWLLVDKILDCVPGEFAHATKTFPRSDLIFMDHFPGMPIVPGVLQIEMIAQTAGKCIALHRTDVLPVLGTVRAAKYYQNVAPGDTCHIKVKIEKIAKSYALAEGEIQVEGKKVCTASVLFGLIDRKKIKSNEFDAVSEDWSKRQEKQKKSEDNHE